MRAFPPSFQLVFLLALHTPNSFLPDPRSWCVLACIHLRGRLSGLRGESKFPSSLFGRWPSFLCCIAFSGLYLSSPSFFFLVALLRSFNLFSLSFFFFFSSSCDTPPPPRYLVLSLFLFFLLSSREREVIWGCGVWGGVVWFFDTFARPLLNFLSLFPPISGRAELPIGHARSRRPDVNSLSFF